MGTALISSAGLVPVLFSIIGILLALRYLKDQTDFSKGIQAVFYGFVFVLVAKVFIWLIPVFEEAVYYFVTLFLRLLSAICFVTGALCIKGVKKTNRVLLMAAGALAGVWSWYVVIIMRDGGLLNVSMAVSTLGYGALAAALWNKKSLRNSLGFVITGWLFIFIALFNLLDLVAWGRNLISPLFETFLYVGVMCGLILVSNNLLAHRFDDLVQEAEESKERLRLMIQKSPFPIIISRLKDDQLMLINDKAGGLFGLDVKHPGNFKTVDYLADPSSRRELLAKLEKKPVVDDFEILVKPRKGEPFWLLLSARVIDFEYEIALYMAFQDITGRKKKEMKLFDQATRDPLTNCYNRRQFEELATKEVQRSRRYHHPFCLFMIDADHFKNVNDTHGHAVGDLVLQALANCCRMTLRESDIVARFGGEEFVILLPEVSLENAHKVAERLRIKISKIVVKNEQDEDVRFTVSIGLVSSTVTDNIEEMLKMADEALYVAKENGRNRVIIRNENGADKNTVPPSDEEILKTQEEPLYYFTPVSAAVAAPPLREGAGVPALENASEEHEYIDDDTPLDDDEEDLPKQGGTAPHGVSLDDLYDDDEPSQPKASQAEAEPPLEDEEPPLDDEVMPSENNAFSDETETAEIPEFSADEPPLDDEEPALPPEDDADIYSSPVPPPQIPEETSVDFSEPSLAQEEFPVPPRPMMKKIKVPAGVMKVKVPKMPGVVRVKIPKSPHTGPVPPPKIPK